jgi:hypothetical protein
VKQHLNLQLKYGVVRFLGTLHHNRNHQLVFESDDPSEAMQQLETRCRADDPSHGYMTIIKDGK